VAKKLLTTPRGVAVYPHLSKPDTKFNERGEYKIKWQGSGADAEALVKRIDAAMKESAIAAQEAEKKEKKPRKVKLATAPYTRNDDGSITVSFKMVASGVSKKTGEAWSRRPAIFDLTGKPYAAVPRVGGGSTVKVSFELNQYARPSTEQKGIVLAGANLRLEAVQIIELVEFGGNAEYFGFSNEGGDEPATPTTETTVEVDDDGGDTTTTSADEF
jgi:ssDNA-binding protein